MWDRTRVGVHYWPKDFTAVMTLFLGDEFMDHGQDLCLSNLWLLCLDPLSSDVELALKMEIEGSSRVVHEKHEGKLYE